MGEIPPLIDLRFIDNKIEVDAVNILLSPIYISFEMRRALCVTRMSRWKRLKRDLVCFSKYAFHNLNVVLIPCGLLNYLTSCIIEAIQIIGVV